MSSDQQLCFLSYNDKHCVIIIIIIIIIIVVVVVVVFDPQ